MFHLEDVLQLKDDEQVKAIIRRHVATLVPTLLLALLCIVVPFFLLFPLFSWGVLGVILFFVAVIFGIVCAVRAMVLWDADVLIITNLRLVEVDQRGLLARTVSEAGMPTVQDVSWSRKGLAQTLFRMGTVRIKTTVGSGEIEVCHVGRPEQVYELINDLRHLTSPKRTDIAPDRLQKLKSISVLLETYSAEELERIEVVLKARQRTDAADAFLEQDDGKNA